MSTPLARLIRRQVEAAGPISVADYMALCLTHPQHGYYTTRQPLGRAGDFTTAPEISQMFGELVGLALAQCWMDHGAPAPFALVEMGPGRGTLMADALRATRGVPGFHAALSLHLVEASPVLRAEQARALEAYAPRFHDGLSDLPEDRPIFLVANELFDALPVRQFLRDAAGWRERLVGPGEGAEALAFGLGPVTPYAALAERLETTPEGRMVETCAPAEALAAELGARLAAQGGAALIVDYGSAESVGDTLQALRAHEKLGPLEAPGESDLTAHVAFGPLARAAMAAAMAAAGDGAGTHSLNASAPTPQGVWLERLGITPRAQALARGLAGPALDNHVAAHRRLIHPDEMGQLFKVMGLSAGGPLPPALDPAGGDPDTDTGSVPRSSPRAPETP